VVKRQIPCGIFVVHRGILVVPCGILVVPCGKKTHSSENNTLEILEMSRLHSGQVVYFSILLMSNWFAVRYQY
jgi:hypothetical protein